MGTIFMTVLGIIAGKLNHDVEDVVVIGTNDGHVLAVGVATVGVAVIISISLRRHGLRSVVGIGVVQC